MRLSFTERDLVKEMCTAETLHVLRLDYLGHKGEKGMRAGEVGSHERGGVQTRFGLWFRKHPVGAA